MTTTTQAIAERWVAEYKMAKKHEKIAINRVKNLRDKLLKFMEEEMEDTLVDGESGATVHRKVGSGPASLDVMHMPGEMIVELAQLGVLGGSVTQLRGLKGKSYWIDKALDRYLMAGGEQVKLEIESS